MGEEKQRSDVADVLKFDPLENPRWRENEPEYPSVKQMINEIVEFQKEFAEKRHDEDHLKRVRKDFLCKHIFHGNVQGDWGVGTLEETRILIEKCETGGESNFALPRTKKETINVYKAYLWLYKKIQEDISEPNRNVEIGGTSEENLGNKELYGLLNEEIVKEAHKMILNDLPLKEGSTKPGECSDRPRYTTYKGEEYYYQDPPDMDKALNIVIDRYNSLIASIKTEGNASTRITNLFKTSSWLLFEFLDLHPFSDGNGRLGRLLCNYVLSVSTPFATPIFNIWSQSSKDDYVDALVNARKSVSKHPEALTTMLIECNWLAWKEFVKQLQEKQVKNKK